MISYMILHDIIYDIIHDIDHDVTYDIIVSQPPPPPSPVMSDWQIRWQSNDFNVSIPSCTGKLGRGEERSLAMVTRRSLAVARSGLEP